MEIGNFNGDMSLEGRKAVITGGSGDIGAATAEIYLQRGAGVVIADVNVEAGEAVFNRLLDADYKNIYFQQVDVTRRESVANLMHESSELLGGINVVIANAGITADRSMAKMTDEDWERVIAVNLTGVFYTLQEGLPYVRAEAKETGIGRLLVTSSVVGESGNFGQTNYAATKAGNLALVKSLAREVGKDGINVMAVSPGFINTAMTRMMPPPALEAMVNRIPLKRIGQPEDIARAFAMLASDDAAYMTGSTIKVDGGITF